MKHFEIQQNSLDWYKLRAGIPTASCFDKIITKKTWLPSSQMDGYANQLIAERILKRPIETNYKVPALEWGNAHEADAIAAYEYQTDNEIKNGGFFVTDDMKVGASPDARVFKGNNLIGLCEMKCPMNPAVHVEFLLMQQMNPDYVPQVQGQMFVSDLEWVDWVSYHPEMPLAIVRTYRDPKFQALFKTALEQFLEIMEKKIARLNEIGYANLVNEKVF